MPKTPSPNEHASGTQHPKSPWRKRKGDPYDLVRNMTEQEQEELYQELLPDDSQATNNDLLLFDGLRRQRRKPEAGNGTLSPLVPPDDGALQQYEQEKRETMKAILEQCRDAQPKKSH